MDDIKCGQWQGSLFCTHLVEISYPISNYKLTIYVLPLSQ
jgi:hypothetical protein